MTKDVEEVITIWVKIRLLLADTKMGEAAVAPKLFHAKSAKLLNKPMAGGVKPLDIISNP